MKKIKKLIVKHFPIYYQLKFCMHIKMKMGVLSNVQFCRKIFLKNLSKNLKKDKKRSSVFKSPNLPKFPKSKNNENFYKFYEYNQ
jgi:hypothetical protein